MSDAAFHRLDPLEFCHSERAGFARRNLLLSGAAMASQRTYYVYIIARQIPPASLTLGRRNDKELVSLRRPGDEGFCTGVGVMSDAAFHRLDPLEFCHSERAGFARRNLLLFGAAMASQRTYYVYIMASKSRVTYVGVTGCLMARVLRHRVGEGGEFTRRYQVHRLVYFASFRNVGDATGRETEIKKWRRGKKVRLIEERNPTWEDLAEGWGEAAVMRVRKTDSG
jgi:putative endonuclease